MMGLGTLKILFSKVSQGWQGNVRKCKILKGEISTPAKVLFSDEKSN